MPQQPDTLPKLLVEMARTRPAGVAIRERGLGIWHEVTWGAFVDHVRQFALGLVALGLRRGDRVCIQSSPSQEWLFADLAVQASGAITVGVPFVSPPDDLLHVALDAGATFFIAQDQIQVDKLLSVRDQLPELRCIITCDMHGLISYHDPSLYSFKQVEALGCELLQRDGPGTFDADVAAGRSGDISAIVYTPGTTTAPRGALLSHGAIIAATAALQNALAVSPRDSVLVHRCFGDALERTFGLYLPLLSGCPVNLVESIDTLARDARETAPTLLAARPCDLTLMVTDVQVRLRRSGRLTRSLLRAALNAAKHLAPGTRESAWNRLCLRALSFFLRPLRRQLGLTRVRCLIAAGAPLPTRVAHFFTALGMPPRTGYAMAEVAGLITLQPVGPAPGGSAGCPLPGPGFAIGIADDGEVLVRSPGLFSGYHGRPEECHAALTEDGWLRTGDLGELDGAGHLRILGRKAADGVVLHAAPPEALEAALRESPYIQETCLLTLDGVATCLVQLESELVAEWAQQHRVPFRSLPELQQRPEVVALIRSELERLGVAGLGPQGVAQFALVDRELCYDNGNLTATHKVRRWVVADQMRRRAGQLHPVQAPPLQPAEQTAARGA